MKVAKLRDTNKKDNKKVNKIEEEKYSLKSFIVILLILSITFGLFYYITYLVVGGQKKDNNPTQIVNADQILLNQMLTMAENEYYVIATKSESKLNGYSSIDYEELYEKYIKDYSSKENSIKFYYVDLNDTMNKSFVGEKLVVKNDLTDLKINDDVLFKIKDSKIEFYRAGHEAIIDYLSKL